MVFQGKICFDFMLRAFNTILHRNPNLLTSRSDSDADDENAHLRFRRMSRKPAITGRTTAVLSIYRSRCTSQINIWCSIAKERQTVVGMQLLHLH